MWHIRLVIAAVGWGTAAAVGQSRYAYDANDPRVGINIWQTRHLGSTSDELAAWTHQIDRMNAAGFQSVTLIPVRYVNQTNGEIFSSFNFNGSWDLRVSISDTNLRPVIAHAKTKGMQVTVNPHFTPTTYTPRSSLDFAPNSPFWANYQSQMVTLAGQARLGGADAFVVGSELTRLLQRSDALGSWSSVIGAVSTEFKGTTPGDRQLGAHTEHWTVADPTIRTNVWENAHLDFIGTSSYISYNNLGIGQADTFPNPPYPLANHQQSAGPLSGAPAFADTVASRFGRWLDDRPLAVGKLTNKPLRLLEFGVSPFDRATGTPWQFGFYAARPSGMSDADWQTVLNEDRFRPYDALEQLRAYQGMLLALEGRNSGSLPIDQRITNVDLWVWGWEGANGGFAEERFFLNPFVTSNIGLTEFDESMSLLSAQFISDWIQGVVAIPEPVVVLPTIVLASGVLLRRSRWMN